MAATITACTVTDPTGTVPLAPPTRLRAAVNGPTSVRVTWEPVVGAERYRLERAPWVRPGQFEMISDTMTWARYDDRGLDRGLGYYYRAASIAGDQLSRFTDSIRVFVDVPSR